MVIKHLKRISYLPRC